MLGSNQIIQSFRRMYFSVSSSFMVYQGFHCKFKTFPSRFCVDRSNFERVKTNRHVVP
jgi:hypothetical protein